MTLRKLAVLGQLKRSGDQNPSCCLDNGSVPQPASQPASQLSLFELMLLHEVLHFQKLLTVSVQ